MVNPAWLPYFRAPAASSARSAAGLSHPAILAREYDVAMIVGTNGIDGITDGARLKLHLDGRVEIMGDAAAAGRSAAAA